MTAARKLYYWNTEASFEAKAEDGRTISGTIPLRIERDDDEVIEGGMITYKKCWEVETGPILCMTVNEHGPDTLYLHTEDDLIEWRLIIRDAIQNEVRSFTK